MKAEVKKAKLRWKSASRILWVEQITGFGGRCCDATRRILGWMNKDFVRSRNVFTGIYL